MFRVVAPLLNRRPYLVEPSSRHSMFHNLSLANGGTIVNQFYTPLWITKSQLTDFYNKVKGQEGISKLGLVTGIGLGTLGAAGSTSLIFKPKETEEAIRSASLEEITDLLEKLKKDNSEKARKVKQAARARLMELDK